MIEIPLQAGVENSHQVFDVQLGDHLFGFELDYQYLYDRWLVNIDVDGERLISGSVLAAGSCLNRSADKYGLIYFIGDDATIDNIGKQNSLVWVEKEISPLTNNIVLPAPSCIYEDFVSTRHNGGKPYVWLKLNDTGYPPLVQSDGSFLLDFDVIYDNFTLTNNIQFGSASVITQSGTTSLSFAPSYLEGSTILQSDFLTYDASGPLNTEIEFWARIGDAPMSVYLTEASTFISIGYVGGKIVGTVETDDYGPVSVYSSANFSAGDIVHVVAQFYDYGVLQDGRLLLYVNGDYQGAVNADGPYGNQFYPPDLTLNVEGDVNTGTPTSIDQLTFYSGDFFFFMNTQTILDTYNCGISA